MHNIFSSIRMQLNMHCLLTHTHPLRHTYTRSPRHCGTHFDPDLNTCAYSRLVARLDFHLCHHIARISSCTFFLSQIIFFFFFNFVWVSWFPVITPYILIFICTVGRERKKGRKQESYIDAEGFIPLCG